jgi:hypothetical protein
MASAHIAFHNVCEMFDLKLLSDITEVEGSTEDNPIVRPVFALGTPRDLSAGIHGGAVTPWFNSEVEVAFFCQRHIERFRRAFEESNETPDATQWEG